MLQRDSLHDQDQACHLLEHSLALDPEFEQTQHLYAETCPQGLPAQPRNLGFEGTTP